MLTDSVPDRLHLDYLAVSISSSYIQPIYINLLMSWQCIVYRIEIRVRSVVLMCVLVERLGCVYSGDGSLQ